MGCRLNGYESEKMATFARDAGLANVVVINSCAVTNEAVRQTRQKIRQIRKVAPDKEIIVTGCAAQIDPASFQEMPEVSSVIGNTEKMTPASWQKLTHTPTTTVSDIMTVSEFPDLDLPASTASQQSRTRAYIQIQNGCDHRCTFCIIPYGRGNSRSVPIENVLNEIRDLVVSGTKEIVLTGVDITSYGLDLAGDKSLGVLVRRILTDIPDLPRLRLSSIDGAEIDETLFQLITEEKRIAPHLHLSLQAGDDMILKRMKRRHTRAQAIDFCKSIREKRPDVVFGADIIAGFPTETEEMFQNSVSLIEKCNLTYLHVFPYSARAGTPAAKMPQVERAVIKERAARLRDAGDAALRRQLDSLTGKVLDVLTEKPRDADISQLTGSGRLANFAEVKFACTSDPRFLQPGQICRVRLERHDGRILYGALLRECGK